MEDIDLRKTTLILALVISIFNSTITNCFSLELQPGTWNHLPVGKNFAGIGYAYTDTKIFIDPALKLENVNMEMHTWVGKYIRTFSMLDKSARAELSQGYQDGKWTGLLNGVPASTSRTGFSDTFIRFAVNLYGGPALRDKAFAAYRSTTDVETIVGVGLAIRLPTGDYMEDKLINLGKNRFAFRPQIGVLHSRGKWRLEMTGEIAFYTDNDDFYNQSTLEKSPLYIIQSHLTYTFRPGLSICASFGYDYGGEHRLDGIDKNDRRQDIAWAFSLNYPIDRNCGIKLVYLGSQTQENVGFDSDTISIGLAFSW